MNKRGLSPTNTLVVILVVLILLFVLYRIVTKMIQMGQNAIS